MDLDELPPQVRFVIRSLDQAMKSREPAIRSKVHQLRAAHATYTNDQLALALIRSTRRRVAATGAISGAASIAPGLGTALAIGTVTSQTIYALEQEVELVLGIAMIFGHELTGSEGRVRGRDHDGRSSARLCPIFPVRAASDPERIVCPERCADPTGRPATGERRDHIGRGHSPGASGRPRQ